MDKIVIRGGQKLKGTVAIGGAKNAVLPIMSACLLARGVSVVTNVPGLKDVVTMKSVLERLGVKAELSDHTLTIDTTSWEGTEAPYDLVRTMRASIYVLGPLLAARGKAKVSLPGGCAWGPRPVDLHIRAMQELGATVAIEHGYIIAETAGLRGKTIKFSIASVGATANTMMAASLADGTTVIMNAAREPEITALAEFINKMGGKVRGAGTDTIEIVGVKKLRAAEFATIPDRIEAGTYLIAGAITAGRIELTGCSPEHLEALILNLRQAGVTIETSGGKIRVRGKRDISSVDVVTSPYPGFPTDLQAQYMALMTVARGNCVISETVFKDRFTHVPELRRMGADIKIESNTAHVGYVKGLSGAPVMATDLRASAALVLAGLIADGETHISRVYHIDRGYEGIESKLGGLGARIERVPE
ncbi:MAG TPA: UDP-N-acetylglucosamine 1-carboxyvinyltransferase [bacterium]|nr:UDP-N-acetylglucosamine 1-carboxyvinyltransferase [bacterium]